MIDLDECGVEMTDADRSLGKAYMVTESVSLGHTPNLQRSIYCLQSLVTTLIVGDGGKCGLAKAQLVLV